MSFSSMGSNKQPVSERGKYGRKEKDRVKSEEDEKQEHMKMRGKLE